MRKGHLSLDGPPQTALFLHILCYFRKLKLLSGVHLKTAKHLHFIHHLGDWVRVPRLSADLIWGRVRKPPTNQGNNTKKIKNTPDRQRFSGGLEAGAPTPLKVMTFRLPTGRRNEGRIANWRIKAEAIDRLIQAKQGHGGCRPPHSGFTAPDSASHSFVNRFITKSQISHEKGSIDYIQAAESITAPNISEA